MKTTVITILAALLVCSLVANYLEFERYSSSRPIVRIDDRVITRKAYQDQLDYKFGKSVLTKLAVETLVEAAAAKAGVTPDDKAVDHRMAQIEQRAPAAFVAAKQDPVKMTELRRGFQTEIALENLRIKDVSASDAEITAFYEKHRASFQRLAQIKTTMAVTETAFDGETAAELLRQGMSADVIAQRPRIKVVGVGGFALPTHLPAGLANRIDQTAARMPVGKVTILPVGKDFLIFRVQSRVPTSIPPLSAIKPDIDRLIRLEKAPSSDLELARLYKNANVTFEVDKYEPYLYDLAERAHRLNGPKSSGGERQ